MSIRPASSEEERFRSTAAAFPDCFPVAFSHHEFPSNASVMKQAGTPFGCLISPFHRMADGSNMLLESRRYTEDAALLARCSVCKGYINPFCNASNVKWICALCGERNTFTRAQARYRSTDPRLLPELQQVIVDFGLPRSDARTEKQIRPLVHVIMVQESMPLDSLQAVVDALVQSVDSVHPDIRVALVTFSNRIGVYRLAPRTLGSSPRNAGPQDMPLPKQADEFMEVNDSHILSPPPLQYVHFVCDRIKKEEADAKLHASTSTFSPHAAQGPFCAAELDRVLGTDGIEAAGILSSVVGDEDLTPPISGASWRRDMEQTIIEGRDAALDFAYAAQSPAGAESVGAGAYVPGTGVIYPGESIRPLLPLGDSVDFWDACARVGQCRASFEAAVSALFDACPSVPAAAFPGFAGAGAAEAHSASESLDPLNMMGPALDAVLDWLISRPSDKLEAQQQRSEAPTFPQNSSMSMLMNLFSGISNLGVSGTSESDRIKELAGGKTGREKDDFSPSSLCSGMVLHVLLATPQDTPAGMHPSVLPNGQSDNGPCSPRKRSVLNEHWVRDAATKAADNNISINIWGIADFASRQLELKDLSPLAQMTGGKLFRFVLGQRPQLEQRRLALQLARSLSEQYATKCLLKIRASSIVNTSASEVVGHCYPSPDLPGVHHIAACAHDNAYSTFLDYHMDSPTTQIEHLVVQVAFSYETLVESEEGLPAEERAAERRLRQLRKDYASKNPSLISNLYSSSVESSEQVVPDSSARRYTSIPKNLLHPEQGELLLDREGNGDHAEGMNYEGCLVGIDQAESNFIRFGEDCWQLMGDAKYWFKKQSDIDSLSKKPKLCVVNSTRNSASSLAVFDAAQASRRRVYDHCKRLVSVRRLRLITVALECTTKIPRLFKNAHVQTIAILVAREVFASRRDGENPVVLVGGLFDWARALTEHTVRLFSRQIADERRESLLSASSVGTTSASMRDRRRDAGSALLSRQDYETIIAEAIDYALKDSQVQSAIHVLFGAMSRIIATFDKRNSTLPQMQATIVKSHGDVSSVSQPVSAPNRGRAGGLVSARGPAAVSDGHSLTIAGCICNYYEYLKGSMPLASGIGFLDGFAEVSSTLLTQDHVYAERYFSPQLYPVRGAAHQLGLSDDGSCPSDLTVDTNLIPSSRSGITWSMMSSGSQLFLLDAGDEIVLYRNAGAPSIGSGVKASVQDENTYNPVLAGDVTSRGAIVDTDRQKLVGNPLWLLNDLRRRVVVSALAPRLYFAQAGTASSGHFHTHLMEQSPEDGNSVTVVTEELRACILAGLMAEDSDWLSKILDL